MAEIDLTKSNSIHVDTSQGNSFQSNMSGTTSSILGARRQTEDNIKNQREALLSSGNEINDYINKIDKLISSMQNLDSTSLKTLERTKEYKNLIKQAEKLAKIEADITSIYESGNVKAKELNSIHYDSQVALVDIRDILDDISDIYDDENGQLKEQNKQLDKSKALRKSIADQTRKTLKEAKDAADREFNESNKSFTKAMQTSVGNLSNKLQMLKQTFDISSIAKMTDRSASTKIQEDLQRAYSLNKSQFKDFKEEVGASINKSIYSSEEVMKVYGDLLNLGIGNVDTATKQFDTILKGQSLLGMSTETQSKLIALGNKTGRDQLKFSTNRIAQYMKSATNLSKEQLDNLISINANTASQMADLGVDSEAFTKSLDDTTVALANYMKGDEKTANLYRDAVTNSMNMNNASQLFGMSTTNMRNAYNSGSTLYDILATGQGMAGNLYKQFQTDYQGALQTVDAYSASGEMDSGLMNLIKQSVDIEKATGKSMKEFIRDYQKDSLSDEALEEIAKNREKMLSPVQKIANFFSNQALVDFDWNFMDSLDKSLGIIIGLLTAIEGTLALSNLGDLFSSFKSGGKGLLNFFSGNGKGLAGKLGSVGKASSWKTLGTFGKAASVASIAAGTIWAGIDAVNGYNNTSKEMYGKDASFGEKLISGTTALFSGSKVHKNSKGKVDTTANILKGGLSGAGKGALIGVGIGSILPGIGPLVGGAIGTAIGGIGGLFSGWFKGKEAKKQEQLQEEQLKEQKKIAENTSKTNDKIRSLQQVQLSSNKEVSYIPRAAITGQGSAPASASAYKAAPKAQASTHGMGAAWPVSSPFGYRTLPNGDSRYHNGIDYGIKTGTPIGAPISGTITSTQVDNRNTYPKGPNSAGSGIYLQGNNGVLYQFWHLSSVGVKKGDSVKQGQTIGLSGNTGYSTGPHLHFGTKVKGAWVNPVPYANGSLWGATGSDYSGTESETASKTSGKTKNNLLSSLLSTYTVNLGQGSAPSIDNSEIVSGLSQINQTLIDLAGKQTQEEQLMRLISGRKTPSATIN